MNLSTAEVLTRGMECLLGNMDIVEAERFIFLVKTEDFDYTKWQRQYFDSKTRAELDQEMEAYFAEHPYVGEPEKIV